LKEHSRSLILLNKFAQGYRKLLCLFFFKCNLSQWVLNVICLSSKIKPIIN